VPGEGDGFGLGDGEAAGDAMLLAGEGDGLAALTTGVAVARAAGLPDGVVAPRPAHPASSGMTNATPIKAGRSAVTIRLRCIQTSFPVHRNLLPVQVIYAFVGAGFLILAPAD